MVQLRPPGRITRCSRVRTESWIIPAMNDTTQLPPLPDRLSIDPKSPHHDAEVFKHPVGIRFNGVERTNVEEYCISEGWIRMAVGRSRDRHGNPMTIKMNGKVEPYYEGSDETEEKGPGADAEA